MPSIPQSLLWISLVVLWLFVLVPMLVSKRDAVRRTSDVALATRVLNSATAARLLRRGGPAAGHRSDPDWQPEHDNREDGDGDLEHDDADDPSPTSGVVVTVPAEPAVANAGPDYLDVEVVGEDSGALSAGDRAAEPTADHTETDVEGDEYSYSADTGADRYDYVEDTSGIPAPEEPPVVPRRQRYDSSKTAAAVSARKYAFRRRVLMTMALMLAASAAAAFVLASTAWWVCGVTATVAVLYLGYLRRQTRIEARVRRRRAQRMARSRLGVENTHDREFDVVPSRLRRPGAVVLEIDDTDPIFEHLDYVPFARDDVRNGDLPRAAGQ